MADNPWQHWRRRFRTMLKEQKSSLAKVAEKLEMAESSLRSWTNGHREINLADFFALCHAAGLDPAVVLFGRPIMTERQREALGELTTSLIEADPAAAPGYRAFGDKVRKSTRARKRADAKTRVKTP